MKTQTLRDAARAVVNDAHVPCGPPNDDLALVDCVLLDALRAALVRETSGFVGYAGEHGDDWLSIHVPDGGVMLPKHGVEIHVVPEPVPGSGQWSGVVGEGLSSRMSLLVKGHREHRFPDPGERLRIVVKEETES